MSTFSDHILSLNSISISICSMDDAKAVEYYSQRLVAEVFGQWVTWWLQARKETFESDEKSAHHYEIKLLDNGIYKLRWKVYNRKKSQFVDVAGSTMCELLRKRRAFEAFKRILKRIGKQPSRQELIRLSKIAQYNSIFRLFQRLRNRAKRQRKASKSIKLLLLSHRTGACKWRVLAQQCVDKLLVNASFKMKDRAKLAQGKQYWKNRISNKYLGESWLVCIEIISVLSHFIGDTTDI